MIDAADKKGRPRPTWFEDRPELPEGPEVDFIFTAYGDLLTCRAPDGPIPWTAARVYALDNGLDAEAFGTLWVIIRAMDAVDRKWAASSDPTATEDEDGA